MAAIRDLQLLDQNTRLNSFGVKWVRQQRSIIYLTTQVDILAESLGTNDVEGKIKSIYDGNNNRSEKILKAFEYLGLFTDFVDMPESRLQIDALSNLFASKLKYGEKERDMVCLHHTFGITMPNNEQV